MSYMNQSYTDIEIDQLLSLTKAKKAEGARFVQVCATTNEDAIRVMYSFLEQGVLCNYVIAYHEGDVIPSITDFFLAAFVFENEVHDLFGVKISGIAIDFEGNFFQTEIKAPMTVISPKQLAAREKAKKVKAAAAAKAAKAAKEAAEKAAAEKTAAESAEAGAAAPDAGTPDTGAVAEEKGE